MSFKIIIECDSGHEAITELLRVADFYRSNPSLSSGAVNTPASDVPVAAETTTAKPARQRPARIAPPGGSAAKSSDSQDGSAVGQEAAAAPASPTVAATTPAPAEPAASTTPPLTVLSEPTVSLTQARAYLSPHLSDPAKSPKVVAIIKQFSPNGRLSEVPEGDLPKLLAAAKSELEVA